ncbi:hypothetical protein MHBO_001691 [Bonamia ostreae]|uniref:Uncharacterized protein n=1 Tax=Bonamia ostreae TaxID=126728 RepID=A0ABV2AKH4_9EUKA
MVRDFENIKSNFIDYAAASFFTFVVLFSFYRRANTVNQIYLLKPLNVNKNDFRNHKLILQKKSMKFNFNIKDLKITKGNSLNVRYFAFRGPNREFFVARVKDTESAKKGIDFLEKMSEMNKNPNMQK